MKHIIRATAAISMAAFMATAAQSEDIDTAGDWSGFYLGGAVGWLNGVSNPNSSTVQGTYFVTQNLALLDSVLNRNIRGDAVSASMIFGYDMQSNRYTYGVEGDLTLSNFKETRASGAVRYLNTPRDFFMDTTVRSSVSAAMRAKIGYSFGSTLVHVSAGPVIANIKYSAAFRDTFSPATTVARLDASETAIGLSLGAGLTHQLNAGWAVRGDYVFNYFPRAISGTSSFTAGGSFNHKVDFQSHNLRLGLIKRF
ncbi:outer membrane beta-barrel protein [Hoeflea sp. AS60]|uniref:outer membrane protein n=1 Tax=Hoeflea sp. AS60 TaxID=3135780 RepID=UPI00316D4206